MSVGSLRLDRAVAQSVLTAIQPAGIDAAVKLTECAKVEDDEKRQALELALERARYEEKRARRQFDAVEPENRLVASELEARWNGAMERVEEAEARLAAAGKTAEPLSESQKQQLTALSEDLMALWNHPEAPIQLKKRILRTLLTDISSTMKQISQHIICDSIGPVECTRNCVWNVTNRDNIATVPIVR